MINSLADWKGVPAPTAQLLEGHFIHLEKLDPATIRLIYSHTPRRKRRATRSTSSTP